MQASTLELMARQCLRCQRIPEESIQSNTVFETHICFEDCGNIFWTLKQCMNCKAVNETRIIEKPKTGQLIVCSKCHFGVYFVRCPY